MLLVRAADDASPYDIPATALRSSFGGFNLATLTLAWEGEGGAVRLLLDAKTSEGFAAVGPASFRKALAEARRKPRSLERRWRLAWGLLGGVLALPAVLLGLFLWFAEPMADWAAARVPPQLEHQLGEVALVQARRTGVLQEQGPAVDGLRRIGSRLVANPGDYRWFVSASPEVNAFAAPGGVVVVNAGLIRRAGSAEELAGVLAHEIAHVELRHALTGMLKGLGLRALLAALFGDYGGLAGVGGQLTELSFSRAAEREADARGLDMLIASGIAPQGMLDFYARMAVEEKSPAALAWLSTHPASSERLAALREAVARRHLTRPRPLEIDWPTLKAALPAA